MASNTSSDQDVLNDNVSKADIDKMIRFIHAHADYKVVKDIAHQKRLSLRQKVQVQSSSLPLRQSKVLVSCLVMH